MVHAVKPQNEQTLRVISGVHHDVNEICNLLEFYTEQSDNSMPTSRGKLPSPEHHYGIITVCCIRSQKDADLKNISYITLGLNVGQVKMESEKAECLEL
jgi:hypothetical protein